MRKLINIFPSKSVVLHPLPFCCLLFLNIFLISFATLSAQGILITSKTSGTWDNPVTWDCNCIPSINDDVTVANGTVVAFNSDGFCNSLTVGQNVSGTFTMGSKPGNQAPVNLVIKTSLIVNTGGEIDLVGNRRTHTLTLGGNIINHGIIVFATLNPNKPECDVTLNNAGSQVIGGTKPISFYSLIVAAGSTTSVTVSGQTIARLIRCDGILNTNGNMTLLSTANQTALIDGAGTGTISGNVTMQRYLPSAFGYKYVSSPFQSATVNEFAAELDLAASFPALYRYNEGSATSGWVTYVTTTDPLNALEGYAANFGSSAVPLTADITGAVNNGALSVTLYNHNNTYTQGFSLAGNPYPSPINWDAATGWTKTNIDNALYYFKASTTDEYGGTYSTYINGVSSDGLATAIIPSMQGFFIHVSDGAYPVTGTLGLDNKVRITDLTHSFLKSDQKSSVPLIRLAAEFAEDTTSADPMVVYFDEKAETGFDSGLDALKLMNTDYYVPNLYSVSSGGKKLSINALPDCSDTLCTIPLGIRINLDGNIIFRIIDVAVELAGKRIFISDKVSGTEHDLLDNNYFNIYLKSGEYAGRFFLNLKSVATGIPEIRPDDDLFSVCSSHGLIKTYINTDRTGAGNLSVSNLTGQILFNKRIFETGYNEFNPGIKDGIYIVSFVSGNYRGSKKVFIKNR